MYPAHSQSAPDQPRFENQAPEPSTVITLTIREKEVLQWSAKGKSSWEIGRIFNRSEACVNYHFANIRRKFGVNTRGSAVLMALELGLIERL